VGRNTNINVRTLHGTDSSTESMAGMDEISSIHMMMMEISFISFDSIVERTSERFYSNSATNFQFLSVIFGS
jgi:hypothetical protein